MSSRRLWGPAVETVATPLAHVDRAIRELEAAMAIGRAVTPTSLILSSIRPHSTKTRGCEARPSLSPKAMSLISAPLTSNSLEMSAPPAYVDRTRSETMCWPRCARRFTEGSGTRRGPIPVRNFAKSLRKATHLSRLGAPFSEAALTVLGSHL